MSCSVSRVMGNSLFPNLLCAQLVAILSESELVGWGMRISPPVREGRCTVHHTSDPPTVVAPGPGMGTWIPRRRAETPVPGWRVVTPVPGRRSGTPC